jgi:Na+-driven multidrug efflux pump
MSTKRIAINALATYTQTAVSLVVGLFCSRWVFNALGETQFGLFSVVGSLIAFISVLNGTIIGSSSRFFAFAIGQARRPNAEEDLLCKWFNTALSVQVILPAIFVLVGAPIGIYAIKNWLTIPDEFRNSSVIIFYFSLFSMFTSMTLSPIQALYTAKQYIFVRNILGILMTFLFVGEGWWLLHYTGNRLIAHAALSALVLFVINVLYVIIGYWQFPEMRVRFKYWFDRKRLVEMFSYSFFMLFGQLGVLFSNSGVAVVLNKFFGPSANAAMGVGTQVYQKTAVLSQGIDSSVYPEITARIGAGCYNEALRLSNRVCVYSTSLILLLAPPLVAFAQEILTLWLKNPPHYAASICIIMIMNMLADKITAGYMMLVQASGRIKLYTTALGIGNAMRCLAVLLLLWWKVPLIPALWIGWFLPFLVITQLRLGFARLALGISVHDYISGVFKPVFVVSGSAFGLAFTMKILLGTSIPAILVSGALNVVVVVGSLWLGIDPLERTVLKTKITAGYSKLMRI